MHYIISRHIGNWTLEKNEENKKKVVARVVDFPILNWQAGNEKMLKNNNLPAVHKSKMAAEQIPSFKFPQNQR